jgi:hypothetical protein
MPFKKIERGRGRGRGRKEREKGESHFTLGFNDTPKTSHLLQK